MGTIWGHGAYVAPDWSADWLHREAGFILTSLAMQQDGKPYEELSEERTGIFKGSSSERAAAGIPMILKPGYLQFQISGLMQ